MRDVVPPRAARLGGALREAFAEGYTGAHFRADLLAGIVVGVVALPLSMALAIASGAAPQHGLYTAIVAGALIALAGGSRVQVSGPTAAFVVLVAPVTARHGLGGLMVTTVMAGLILVLLGVSRLGRLIQFVPSPVTSGFTAGIGLVIATLQLKDFLGLETGHLPDSYMGKVAALARALPTVSWADGAVGAGTLALLVLWPRISRRVPGPLVALSAAAVAAWALRLPVATIASRFGGIPRTPPPFGLPWDQPGPGGAPLGLSWDLLRDLAPSALAMAMLGSIESLLSAVIADSMVRRQHDPDAELVAQGIGNLVAPFLGGFVATGAIARTATNVRAGGRSPVAAITHALFVLLAMVALAPLLGRLPMAALAALLLVVAWNMSEARHVARAVRTSPRSDAAVLLVCFGLTVAFDMVVAVTAGIMLAALLFMRRMSEVFDVALVSEPRRLGRPLSREIVLYQIHGPLFFGAARRAFEAMHRVERGVRVVVLDLRGVPTIDASGLVNLRSVVEGLVEHGMHVVLAGVRRAPLGTLLRAGWHRRTASIEIVRSFERGLARAERAAAGR